MSEQLRPFFAHTVRPFFLFTGAGTALVGLYAFFPSWAMPNVARLPYLQDYTIIIQHWGIMVGLMGVVMMAAAVVPVARADLPVWRHREVLHGLARAIQCPTLLRKWLLGSLRTRFDRCDLYGWLFSGLWISQS